MSDLISRKDAIDEVKRLHSVAWGNWKETRISANTMIDALKDLPSAEKAQLSGEGTTKDATSDLISRKDAIEAVDDIDWYHQNKNGEMVSGANPSDHQAWYKAEDIYNVLESLPSAQPEIIRCKDCKHYAPEVGDDSYALGYCPFIGSHLVMSNGFCAWGERREE